MNDVPMILFCSNDSPAPQFGDLIAYEAWTKKAVAFLRVNDEWISIRKDCNHLKIDNFKYKDLKNYPQ